MASPLDTQTATPLDLASLINTAQDQTTLFGISKILEMLAGAVGAYGCILWRGDDFHGDYLFALAQWSEDGKKSDLHYLPRQGSATGAAVASGQIRNVPDLDHAELVNSQDTFFKRAKIKNFCAVPMRFPRGIDGALNFYRNVKEPFDEVGLNLAQQATALVPSLYQIIRDRVGLSLIEKVNDLLRDAERTSDTPLEKNEMKAVMESLCSLVRDTLQCLETSIFLADRLESGTYDLWATTWPREEEFPRNSYQREEDSLTGWVLANAKSVRIFDLSRFEDDKEQLRGKYPRLVWQDSLKIQTAYRRIFNLKPDDPLPPLSYMATPIRRGPIVRGVIRSCVGLKGPVYFADQELELLELVAAQIGYYWSNWLGRRGLKQENTWWQELVKGVTNLNSFVQGELSREDSDENRIFAETFRTTRVVLHGADINDIRLYDKETRELKFVAFDGEAWEEGSPSEIEHRKKKSFSVEGKSAGAHVYRTGEVYVIPDVKKDPYYSPVFLDTKRKIVAPIGIKSKLYGVLDIRGTGADNFPPHAAAIAALLGQQVGLYHYCAEKIEELRELDREQIQAFQDVEHQLKSPINLAYNMIQSIVRYDLPRLQLMLSNDEITKRITSRFLEVRGLSRKAKRVTKNMRLLACLAQKLPIPVKPKRLNYEVLLKVLIDAAKDSTLMVDPVRKISFSVDTESFELLNTLEVQGDQELIEQAVMNLLDNAGKYSFDKTIVQVYAQRMPNNQFCITVANIGVPIRAKEVHLAQTRTWRSEKAEWTTGEGSGIGLWIVYHIMRAHKGELLVIPTTPKHLTEVKLIFGKVGDRHRHEGTIS
jgi:signal transduction histidine kinase